MYFDDAEGMVFRPPSEANSFILRVTIGCSHNRCSFCSMYRDVPFRIRPFAEIETIILRTAQYFPSLRRVFLADGNALVLPTDSLLRIMNSLRSHLPKLARITCYAGPKDILHKTPAELAALKAAGLSIIYLGIESGDDIVLASIDKGVTASELAAAGRKVMSAGIKLSAMIILGIGGTARTLEHARATAALINEIEPTMLSALSLMVYPETPLYAAVNAGEFELLSPYGLLLELQNLLQRIEVTKPCIFRSTHISNALPLAGTLPKEKEDLLADIQQVLEHFKNKNIPTHNAVEMF